jgi:hypothetical protein
MWIAEAFGEDGDVFEAELLNAGLLRRCEFAP